MALKETIKEDLTNALKEKSELTVSVLKMLVSSINNEEIKQKKKEEGISEEDTEKVVKSEAKKRKDSIDSYQKANREDLAKKEQEELDILKKYLPEEMPDEEIENIVKSVVAETGASSQEDFGKVMKEVMTKTKGQADGKKISEFVRKYLS